MKEQALEKSYFIKTFGCQMNHHDTDRMSFLLQENGYTPSKEMRDANLILFNTCSIRDKAHNKGVSSLGMMCKLKRSRPHLKLGFTGCVAQHEKSRVFKKFPELNFVLGTDNIDALPEVLYRMDRGEKNISLTGFDPSQNYSIETKVLPGSASVFMNIMKGCDNFCTYCIVPFTRGREKSRRLGEVVADIEQFLLKDVVEVTLLGQNVNSYGKSLGGEKEGQTFPLLLRAIEKMADRLDREGVTDPTGKDGKPRGLRRLRYTTSHPKDFDEEMIACHKDLKRLVPHLHLPVQSGSEAVLKRMKRFLPIGVYLDRIQKLRAHVPGISITTDMIVGFSGETQQEFEETMDLINTVQFNGIYAYTYSPRPGTKAIALGDTVPDEVKKERLHCLHRRQRQIQEEKNAILEGKVMEVLVEGASKSNATFATGRIPQWTTVNFSAGDAVTISKMKGRFLPVRIISSTAFALQGQLL